MTIHAPLGAPRVRTPDPRKKALFERLCAQEDLTSSQVVRRMIRYGMEPLQADLETKLGRAVRIANDANCFAISEATDGAAEGAAVVERPGAEVTVVKVQRVTAGQDWPVVEEVFPGPIGPEQGEGDPPLPGQ